MATRTITAMFDNRADAERAVQALVSEAGVDRSGVRLDPGAGVTDAGYDASRPYEEKGFFASLKDIFVPDEDRYAYAEGLRRGGALVSARVEDSRIDRAMDVLERCGAVDLDEREAEWRRSGWSGYDATAAGAAGGAGAMAGVSSDGSRTGVSAMPGAASAPDGAPGNPPGTMLSRGLDQAAGTNTSGAHPENEARGTVGAAGGAMPARSTGTTGDEYIPIAEERLTVGKRAVNRGRVRVRSYVVETPVEERVSLRDETVEVERRTVNRPVTAADEALFAERTIEAVETDEEAVVAKEARVVEELVVRKDAEERVQTVQDTVRRTEVEIDDQRTAGGTATGPVTKTGTAAPTGAPTTRPPGRDRR